MTQHSMAYLIEEGRRNEQVQRMAAQRAARMAAQAAGTLPAPRPEPRAAKRRVATRGGGVGLPERLQDVLDFLSDGQEHTVQEGAAATDMGEISFSSRLRSLRAEQYGSHNIQRRSIRSHERLTTYYKLVVA